MQKKISFFGSISILISSVIGVGIFFKNKSVFEGGEYNWKTILFAWLLISFICLITAYVYSKISLIEISELGLNRWSEILIGKKFSLFIRKSLVLFYFGIIIPGFCFYAAELILMLLKEVLSQNPLKDPWFKYSTVSFISLVGLMILFSIVLFNCKFENQAINLQKIFVVFKFIPILIISILGIYIWSKSDNPNNLFVKQPNDKIETNTVGVFSIPLLLKILPGILFTFDSFLNVGYLSPRIQNPKKTLPRALFCGILICAIFYLFITVSLCLNGTGVFTELFSENKLQSIFSHHVIVSQVLRISIISLILISSVGLINGYSCTAWPVFRNIIKDDLFSFGQYLRIKSKGNFEGMGCKLWLFICTFWSAVLISSFYLFNSDDIVDGLTNLPTLLFFCIYGTLPLGFVIRRIQQKIERNLRFYVFNFLCIFIFIAWYFIVFYQIIGVYIYGFFEPSKEFSLWRGYVEATKSINLTNFRASIIFFGCLFLFVSLPLLDECLKKKVINKKFERFRLC